MPVYEYKALDAGGKNLKGIVDAESESQARTKLRASGKYPVSIRRSTGSSAEAGKKSSGVGIFQRIRPEEVYVMTRQLATLLGAGVPLVQALSSLVDQTPKAAMKQVIAQVRETVNEGATLTRALSDYPKLFSNIYINMIRAGEASGSLAVVLERLADFGEKQQALKGRLQVALIYPIFMALVGTGILFVLITYVVPNITQVFTDMNQVLPLPTQLLIAFSAFVKQFWWLLVGIIVALISLFRYWLGRPSGRSWWDLIKLRIPIVGPVVRKIILARFASTLGSLLNSGVGLLAAMQIVRALIDNVRISAVLDETMEHIERGKSMTASLSNSPWFPPMFVQMVAVGEQSGALETMLEKVANAYEREVETAISSMTAMLEPLMILVMGMAVLFIVLSILLPIFQMNQIVH